jgi:hypothetical protein
VNTVAKPFPTEEQNKHFILDKFSCSPSPFRPISFRLVPSEYDPGVLLLIITFSPPVISIIHQHTSYFLFAGSLLSHAKYRTPKAARPAQWVRKEELRILFNLILKKGPGDQSLNFSCNMSGWFEVKVDLTSSVC